MKCFLTLAIFVAILTASAKVEHNSFRLPEDLRGLLDEHRDELRAMIEECKRYKGHCPTEIGVRTFAWLSDYIVKYSIDRLDGAEKLRHCIAIWNLDRLVIPAHYVVHVQGSSSLLTNETHLVLESKVKRARPHSLSLEEVEQLCILVYELGYWDIYSENLFFTQDGKIALLDTEARSFDYKKITDALSRFVNHRGKIVYNYGLEKEALTYIFDQIKYCLRKQPEEKHAVCTSIWNDFQYIKDATTRLQYERLFNETFH